MGYFLWRPSAPEAARARTLPGKPPYEGEARFPGVGSGGVTRGIAWALRPTPLGPL